MIAVDTNILVYATRTDSIWQASAAATIRALAQGDEWWAIPWPCVSEFFCVVTHPKIHKPPTPAPIAVAQIEAWLESPRLKLLGEIGAAWETLRDTLASSRVVGPMVYDARIAALCAQHGVDELLTADRDFSRFPGLRVRNPLIPNSANEPRGRYKLGAAALKKQSRAR